MEDMYEAWALDPKSVHPSWDSYFRNGGYQAPPTLGAPSNPNEVPLSSLVGGMLQNYKKLIAFFKVVSGLHF